MGIFNFWKKDARNNHTFDEKDRELSAKRRAMKIELDDAMQRNKIEEENMRHELEMAQMQLELEDMMPEETNSQGQMSEEGMLLNKLLDKLDKPKTALGANPTSPPAPSVPITDEQLRNMLKEIKDKYPALIEQIPKHTDNQIADFINAKIQPLDAETMVRAIKICRYG